MPIVPRAYVTPVPDGIVDAEGRAFAHSRGAWCVVRDAGSMFEPRRCARHSFRYALAPGCRLHRRSRVQAVRQRDDLTDTDIERSGKARRRMNRARDSPARRERRIFHARAKMSARLDHSGERRQSRQARGAPSGSIGERRRPDIADDRSAPIAAARVAPCAMRRRARNDRCEASRSFHAALLRIHVVPLRITDGQMGRWRNTTSRNNFLLKLKKPAKPALQGSAKRFDAL
ncbi:oxidoreductase [Burkholderia pseudomallei]|uniref:oxidoreductase n=1 Tax=Burkholderia pseudomallei TaxID=28450 RepID=UPI001F2FBC34|nr:oxidoreductase [Burkholderia pseudomallei]